MLGLKRGKEYDLLKLKLAKIYELNRTLYTDSKQNLTNKLLIESKNWRLNL